MGNNQFGQLGIGREFKSHEQRFNKENNILENIQIDINGDNSYITQPRYVFGLNSPAIDIA
jgi:hypothetical protein